MASEVTFGAAAAESALIVADGADRPEALIAAARRGGASSFTLV